MSDVDYGAALDAEATRLDVLAEGVSPPGLPASWHHLGKQARHTARALRNAAQACRVLAAELRRTVRP